jgi:hypothetical protein
MQVFSDTMRTRWDKETCHGLPRSRPQKRGYASGTHPTRQDAAPSSPCQKRDQGTHRHRPGSADDRGPHRSKAARGGAGVKPAGQRLAPDIGHRVDTRREAKGLSLCIGGQERVAEVCVNTLGKQC